MFLLWILLVYSDVIYIRTKCDFFKFMLQGPAGGVRDDDRHQPGALGPQSATGDSR